MIKRGNIVQIEYSGTLEDGTEFDSSKKHGSPLEFQTGAGMIMPGFEDALVGLNIGDEKDIVLQPSQAYGDVNGELIKQIPKDQLQSEQEVKEGMVLVVSLPNGNQIPAIIEEVKGDIVTINLNHPLAGKVLHFHIKVVGIKEGAEEKSKEGKPSKKKQDKKL